MKRVVAVCLVSLFPATAWSADLLEIYRDAIVGDARFAAARAEFEAGLEKRIQGRAGLLPNVGLTGNSTWNVVELKNGTNRYNSNSFTVTLTQPLFRWQNWIEYKQGELLTTQSVVRLEQARQDLILRVAEAYFNVLNAQDVLAAQTQLREAAAEQLEISKTSFEVGTVTITDVHEAQSRFDLASAQEIQATSNLDILRETLALIVGKEPEPLAGLRAGVELARPKPDSIVDWVGAAERENYGVQLQQLTREVASREVQRSNAGHLPTLDIVATRGRNRSGFSVNSLGSASDPSTIGVQVTVPIFQGGAVSSRTREAAALKVKADADLDDARRSAALAARQAYLGVTSGMAQVRALEAAQLSSNSALEANRLGYEVGVRINIDVLNSLSQLAETRRQLARARYDTLLAQLRLKAAAGTLGEADVEQINALLE